MKRLQRISLLLFIVVLLAGRIASASDLDDGISKPMDDTIEHDDELGQKDHNVTFIKQRAKSEADVAAHGAGGDQGMQQGAGGGNGNLNSVVLGPGGNVRGDIIIIDESRGDKTQVIGR